MDDLENNSSRTAQTCPSRSHSQVISKLFFVDDETVFTDRLKQPVFANLSINMLIRACVVPTISDNSSCKIFSSMQMPEAILLPSVRVTAKASRPAAARYSPYWRSPDTGRQCARPANARSVQVASHGLILTEWRKNNAGRESRNSDKSPPVFRTIGRHFRRTREARCPAENWRLWECGKIARCRGEMPQLPAPILLVQLTR